MTQLPPQSPKRPPLLPAIPLHQPGFKYVPAVKTDIRLTFDRLMPGWRKPK
jgi:hypothetical protein